MGIQSEAYLRAASMLAGAKRILATTHIRPDGDAVGSLAAIKHVLEESIADCHVQILLLSSPGDMYKFLLPDKTWIMGRDITVEQAAAGDLDHFDAFIVCDTGTKRQLEGIYDVLLKWQDKVIIIDHHLANDGIGRHCLVDTSASAAGEMVYELCRQGDWTIKEQAASALFVAIATDTGWFRFENTSVRSLEIVADLIRKGVQPDRLYQQLFQQDRPERLKLQAAVMQTLELHCSERLAVIHITKAMLEKTGAKRWEIENIVNEPMRLGTVVACILLVEQDDGTTRCSLRSKAVVDVNAVANMFGGGGHARAAGVTLNDPLDQAKEKIILEIMSKFDLCEDVTHHHRGKSSENRLNKDEIMRSLTILEGQVVLDAGCGDGYMAKEFAKRVKATGKVYALDPDETQIDIFRSACKTTVIEPFVGDITQKTKLKDASIDVIYLSTVIHGFSEIQMNGFIVEVQRLLKPQGTLAILEIKKEKTPFGPPLSIRWSSEDLKARIPLKPKQTRNIGKYFYLQLFEK